MVGPIIGGSVIVTLFLLLCYNPLVNSGIDWNDPPDPPEDNTP